MRAQVALVDDGLVLLARHRRPGHEYWVLPGGAVEDGESPEEAAVREMREETGLQVVVERLLFVDEPRREGSFVIKQPRFTYLGRVVGGRLSCVEDPDSGNPGNGYLCAVSWMPFDSEEYDAATRDTLCRLESALKAV